MNICIPVKNEIQTLEVTGWKEAEYYLMYQVSTSRRSLISVEDFESGIEQSGYSQEFSSREIEQIVCHTIPVMASRILKNIGIDILFASDTDIDRVIEQWRCNTLSAVPLINADGSNCTGSCTSCSSTSC